MMTDQYCGKSAKKRMSLSSLLYFALLIGTASAGCKVGKVTCYEEPNQKHMWNDQPNTMSTGMSQEWCAQLCSKDGHKMAGVEYGTQCFVSFSGITITEKMCKKTKSNGFYYLLLFNDAYLYSVATVFLPVPARSPVPTVEWIAW